MVVLRIVLLFLSLIGITSTLLSLQEIDITPEINQYESYENRPLRGNINVTHPKDQKVDPSTFTIDNKPLKVEFVRDVNISPDLIISIYHFSIPGMKAGLQLLPPIGVKIGGKIYQSVSTGFEVKGGTGPLSSPASVQNIPQAVPSDGKAILKLEAFYHGDTPLYPGQRGWVGYRYIFNQSTSLSEEVIPLLDALGFKKIGGKNIDDHEEGNFSVRQISQQIEALTPGAFRFGPSAIKGLANRKTVVAAWADPVEIIVASFPEKGRPASFLDAVGQYTFDVQMVTPAEVREGEKVVLAVTIGGNGQLATIKPPELCCQPGFSGRFKASDLPPVGKVSGRQVEFMMEVRPLSSSIKEVPSIEFSYFDPLVGQYGTVKSNPIPLKVIPVAKSETAAPAPLAKPTQTPEKKEQKEPKTEPIEIEGNDRLTPIDLYNIPFGSWWSLILIPVALGVIYLQYNLKQSLKKMREEAPKETSKKLFTVVNEAIVYNSEYYYLLNRSFFLLFKEKGLLDDIDITPHKLPPRPPFQKVREFLLDLEKRRFGTGQGKDFSQEDKETYQTLFHEVQGQEDRNASKAP